MDSKLNPFRLALLLLSLLFIVYHGLSLEHTASKESGVQSMANRWLNGVLSNHRTSGRIDLNDAFVAEEQRERRMEESYSSPKQPSLPTLLPLTYRHAIGFLCVSLGVILAAGGGIGGGGLLVPTYLLVLQLPVKYAISTSSITIFGGALANVWLNSSKPHPVDVESGRGCVDWTLTLLMEPPKIGGALIGTLFHSVLPDVLLIFLLLICLSATAYKTICTANRIYCKESELLRCEQASENTRCEESMRLIETDAIISPPCTYQATEIPSTANELSTSTDIQKCKASCKRGETDYSDTDKIWKFVALFAIVTALNFLMREVRIRVDDTSTSPIGTGTIWGTFSAQIVAVVSCAQFFVLTAFVVIFRAEVLRKKELGLANCSDIEWDQHNTIRYPILCVAAGIVAGLFGVGGGLITGPLMLEVGVHPLVASASSAAMIAFTSATASIGYLSLGHMLPDYATVGFVLGFFATFIGQTAMTALLRRFQRPSYVAYSIGIVVAVSAVCMTLESVVTLIHPSASS